jgi:hypothetical protein
MANYFLKLSEKYKDQFPLLAGRSLRFFVIEKELRHTNKLYKLAGFSFCNFTMYFLLRVKEISRNITRYSNYSINLI